MLNNVKLYRRRFIPDEIFLLNDNIIHVDKNVIITKWNAFHAKEKFSKGHSCVYINEGFKVSKFYDSSDNFSFTYCDIVNVKINGDEYIVEDLLADVIIEKDLSVKVVDLDEIADAIDKNLITVDMAKDALRKTNRLLSIIYSGNFDKYNNF